MVIASIMVVICIVSKFGTFLRLPSRVKFPARIPSLFTLPLVALRVIPLVAVNVLFCAISILEVIFAFVP